MVDANDEDEKKERNEHGLHGLLNQLKESQKAHALFAADAQTKEQVKPKLKPVEPSSASDSEIEVFGGDLFKESKFKGLKANQHEEVDLEDVLEKQMDYVVLGNISYWFQFMFFSSYTWWCSSIKKWVLCDHSHHSCKGSIPTFVYPSFGG